MERGGMPLHDPVGVNCKMGVTSENRGKCVKYMAYDDECVFDDFIS